MSFYRALQIDKIVIQFKELNYDMNRPKYSSQTSILVKFNSDKSLLYDYIYGLLQINPSIIF